MTKKRPQHEHREAWNRAIQDRFLPLIPKDAAGAERLMLVSKLVPALRVLLDREPDDDARFETICTVLELLQLAASEFEFIREPLQAAIPGGAAASIHPRRLLQWYLELTVRTLLPQARRGQELVLVPMPAAGASELLNAVRALNAGEVLELLAPAPSQKHGRAYTWQDARIRALQHVAYLVGQGFPKGAARKRVSLATGISIDTLRGWERELDASLITATEAGRIETIERDGGIRPSPIDAHVDLLLDDLRSEPLSSFGRYYQDNFGKRHWGAGDTGAIPPGR